jgi:hypothetical protein
MKQRSCNGRGGAQRPVRRGNAPKKKGARSARARTRGQNPLVYIYYIYKPPNSLEDSLYGNLSSYWLTHFYLKKIPNSIAKAIFLIDPKRFFECKMYATPLFRKLVCRKVVS